MRLLNRLERAACLGFVAGRLTEVGGFACATRKPMGQTARFFSIFRAGPVHSLKNRASPSSCGLAGRQLFYSPTTIHLKWLVVVIFPARVGKGRTAPRLL